MMSQCQKALCHEIAALAAIAAYRQCADLQTWPMTIARVSRDLCGVERSIETFAAKQSGQNAAATCMFEFSLTACG